MQAASIIVQHLYSYKVYKRIILYNEYLNAYYTTTHMVKSNKNGSKYYNK